VAGLPEQVAGFTGMNGRFTVTLPEDKLSDARHFSGKVFSPELTEGGDGAKQEEVYA